MSHPGIPPSNLAPFPLVTALRVFRGDFAALVTIHIIPGQSLFVDKVELGVELGGVLSHYIDKGCRAS